MATRRTFGKTWWGNAWVEAMERIDYNTNRLPRGRRYANGGMVKEINITDSKVFAKVQGSRPRPYDIRINLEKFSRGQLKTLKSIIAENPVIASELTLGVLPEELLDALNKNNIYLLPTTWDDIDAKCSCPDWANPCKHLAAVYYIIANEIDKNPFLILNLRGISSETLMDAAGLSLKDPDYGIPEREKFISYRDIVTLDKSLLSSEDIDLSFEKFDIDSIFSLLPDSPLFYQDGDFKKILLQAYKNVINFGESINIIESSLSFKDTNFCLCIPHDERHVTNFFVYPLQEAIEKIVAKSDTLDIPEIVGNKLQMKKIKGGVIRTDSIFDIFFSLPLDLTLKKNSLSARFLNVSTSVALSLASSASFLPEVIRDEDSNFSIRYVPLSHSEKISKAIEYLSTIMPENFVYMVKDGKVLTGIEGVSYVLSMMLTHIVKRFSGVKQMDKLCGAFFRGKIYSARQFEEKQTEKAISDWLERLSVRKRDISPVIRIETIDDACDRFKLKIDVENKKEPLMPPLELSEIFDTEKPVFSYPPDIVRRDVFRQITIASEYMPPLKDILSSKGKKDVTISSVKMAGFITDVQGTLNILGIRVVIPKELRRLAFPRLAVGAELKAKGKTISYLSLDKMLNFSWKIAIGDMTISKKEFLELVRSTEGIVRFKDQYIMLKPEEIRNILERLNKPLPRVSSMEVLQASLTGEIEGMLFDPDDAIKRIIDNLTKVEDVPIPSTLKAALRPYQERGFRWLYSNVTKGLGSCIADDMGLGKTIQVITLILKLKDEKWIKSPILVICPTTLLGNWKKECERFSPSLKVLIYHGTKRRLDISRSDLVITSYGILRRDIHNFRDKDWRMLVIDEAQNIKNPDTDQTKAVKSISAPACIAMSGTPVENRLTELWSIFDFINKGYLGPLKGFIRRYAIPIEKYRDRTCIEKLRQATAPFIIRRLKTDRSVINDLPDKIISDEYCYLTKEQAAIYKQVVDFTMKEIQNSEGLQRRGLVFKLITSLKQICNHPVHYSKKGIATKEQSGKAEKAISLLDKIISVGEKALLFTQYMVMGELLVDMIKGEFKKDPLFFHGGVPRYKRDRMVEEFQSNGRYPVMIVSLKAGGTGLNLTAATNVIHYDLWWNPAVEAQATDRTYRIGQMRNVIVHRLITLGTFEEKIDEMIKAKKELADLTVATGEQWITELSDRELKEIFSLSHI